MELAVNTRLKRIHILTSQYIYHTEIIDWKMEKYYVDKAVIRNLSFAD